MRGAFLYNFFIVLLVSALVVVINPVTCTHYLQTALVETMATK